MAFWILIHFPTAYFFCSKIWLFGRKVWEPLLVPVQSRFPTYCIGKLVAPVLTVSLVWPRFVIDPHRATMFLSVLFQRGESRQRRHATVYNNKPTRTPLTDFCCAQPSPGSVDWTCLDGVCCDVPSKKDEDVFIVILFMKYEKLNSRFLEWWQKKVSLSMFVPQLFEFWSSILRWQT